MANILASRIDELPKKEGIYDLENYVQPLSKEEAKKIGAYSFASIPKGLARKLGRSQVASVEELIEQEYITSGDVLAIVLPQITSAIKTSNISDHELKRLYAEIYRVFRKRRSLLLLNLESQVKIEELPWVNIINKYRQKSLKSEEVAKSALTDIVKLAIVNFPHAILPNKLLQEIAALAKQANLELLIVDEVAADIFMGEFSPKYAHAASIAADFLKGSLYEKYYQIDYSEFGKRKSFFSKNIGKKDANEFSKICISRAPKSEDRWSVAGNGVIIEQQQILTTQNLAALFSQLELDKSLLHQLPYLVKKTFKWICARQQKSLDNYHSKLIMTKNTAYAWRQLIFYLSLIEEKEIEAIYSQLQEYLSRQQNDFTVKFQPVLNGLAESIGLNSGRMDTYRPFLGWTIGSHPLIRG